VDVGVGGGLIVKRAKKTGKWGSGDGGSGKPAIIQVGRAVS